LKGLKAHSILHLGTQSVHTEVMINLIHSGDVLDLLKAFSEFNILVQKYFKKNGFGTAEQRHVFHLT